MPVTARDGRDGEPIRWESWRTWRGGRLLPEHVVIEDVHPAPGDGSPIPVSAAWCATCSRTGRILTRVCGRLVPATCPTCHGTG